MITKIQLRHRNLIDTTPCKLQFLPKFLFTRIKISHKKFPLS
jgi:hypothetical protein